MMTKRQRGRKGNTMLEFALVGIPMIFMLLSVVEIARGMWTYHTLAYAVREGVRYATVHGIGCASPNTCQVTIGTIATVIQSAGIGLDRNSVTLTFTSASGSASTGTMASQTSSTTTWPPSGDNAPGQNVKIKASYPFRTFLAALWPGALASSGVFILPASSTEPIQF